MLAVSIEPIGTMLAGQTADALCGAAAAYSDLALHPSLPARGRPSPASANFRRKRLDTPTQKAPC